MQKIVLDSQPFNCTVMCDNIIHDEISQNIGFKNSSSMLNIGILSNQINNESINIIKKKELKFLEALIREKKNDKCWVRMLNKKKYNIVSFNNDDNYKINLSGNITDSVINNKIMDNFIPCRINDNLEIVNIETNNKMKICRLKELYQNNSLEINISLQLYAVISDNNGIQNIEIRLKLNNIKIIKIDNKILKFFQVSKIASGTDKYNNGHEFIQKYPSKKQNIINNILEILKSH
jgi:hypothetical protein